MIIDAACLRLAAAAPVAAVAFVAAVAAGCAADVPSEPTWIDDVRPILVANCVRCHSVPPQGGAPNDVRFDQYENVLGVLPDANDDGTPEDLIGAQGAAPVIAARVRDEEMPPRFPLRGRQIDVLANWSAAGAPRGERADNGSPELQLDSTANGGRIVFTYQMSDPDDDLVTGSLLADPGDGGEPIRISYQLFSGSGQVVWNTDGLEAGFYELTAEVDDGVEVVSIDAGGVEVTP